MADIRKKVTLFNKGINVTTVSFSNWDYGEPKSLVLKGGQTIDIYNDWLTDPDDAEAFIPDNTNPLNLTKSGVFEKTDFSYNVEQVKIKIVNA